MKIEFSAGTTLLQIKTALEALDASGESFKLVFGITFTNEEDDN